jgi:TetR/AcrR family transcriptional repressor of nem operon
LTYDTDQVLDEAMRLFWQNGYEATSLQDLVGAMDLSRSSFYHGFGNKHDLFLRCLERYRERTTTMLWDRLDSAPSGRDFIADTLAWATAEASSQARPKGCLIMNTATEFARRDPQIAALVSQGLRAYRAIFEAAIERGQTEGSIRGDKEPGVLATYLVTGMGGLRTMVKAGTDVATLSEMVTIAMDALDH